MIKHSLSWWGIKNNGEDITSEIMRIINDADLFIIVCGYNFTFKTSAGARPFFDALTAKSLAGVHILLIFPPKLHGKYNPQPRIINHCMINNLPVILNHQNHSKWLLTDKDLYYGSSNFTDASWKDRVEVLSIHEHTKLAKSWSRDTIKDFGIFINKEIADLNKPKRRMKNYRGLLTSTRNSWKSIKPIVQKFNPAIEKVIITLKNYDKITSIINEEVVLWFDNYTTREFEIVCNLSSKILRSLDRLCEYAYGNIYNETMNTNNTEIETSIIDGYNELYERFHNNIDKCIEELQQEIKDYEMNYELADNNLRRINYVKQLIDRTINYDSQ